MQKDTKAIAALLYEKGFLNYQDYNKTLGDNSFWQKWIQNQAFLFGAVLLLAGVLCFFAYNWENMGKFLKLGLPLCAFIALGLAAAFTGLEKPYSKVLSTAAAFMAGVFCAVFGQTYQTGADAWQLFFTWALCILPFALLTFSIGLWLLFLVVSNIFFFLYPFDYNESYFYNMFNLPFIYVLIFNGCFLALSEFCRNTKKALFSETYFRNLVYIYLLIILFMPSIAQVYNISRDGFGYIALFLSLAVGFTFYFIKTKQAITLIGLNALGTASILCALFTRNFNNLSFFLINSFVSILIFGSAAYGVYKAHLYIKGAK